MTQDDNSQLSRRSVLATGLAALAVPQSASASPVLEISWEDLIPPGVPYSEIVAEGEVDIENDRWLPEFDKNAREFNDALKGKLIRLPGYIIPLDISAKGVTQFILVPYVGACIHVPPPPPNQLVMVAPEEAWPNPSLWLAVWVSGILRTSLQSTSLAEIGYEISGASVEEYVW